MLIYLSMLESEEDKLTFQKIYQKNYLSMYHVAFGLLKHEMDSENAVQEAFVSIAENFRKYKSLSCREMTGLCVTIVKNKSIDIIRKEKHISDETIENIVIQSQNNDYDPEASIDRNEIHISIRRIMDSLPEVLKITLDLKYYYEYSNKEIARILEIPVKTVEMRLYRAKLKLKEMVKREGNT